MSLAELEIRVVDGVLVAALEGEIDMSNARDLGDAISARISNDVRGLVLDLTEVEYLDSAALHMLFDLRARLAHRGQAIRLVVPSSATIARALEIMSVPRTIGIAETPEEALESVLEAVPETRSASAPNPDSIV